jgi:hypothetical protein
VHVSAFGFGGDATRRWDQEAALSGPRLGCGLETHSRNSGGISLFTQYPTVRTCRIAAAARALPHSHQCGQEQGDCDLRT